ncbi:hypothetical protein GE061_008142 [Apolygus lucorum]|uniref:Uncharacterized protein n=1 Tax=Apolygus lucorum TaxID=248454 RepID=A0A8S9WQ99_APOLU|nr:hypothetical protein GE061_008142 [Apolygus lucorum]
MNVWWAARLIGMLLVPVCCWDLKYADFQPRHGQYFYNVLKHTTDSLDTVLKIVKFLNLQVDDLDYYYVLGSCEWKNKEIFNHMSHIYDDFVNLMDWDRAFISKDELKELEHADNYSEVLKRMMEETSSRLMNSTDDLSVSHCQIMPIGPERVMNVVVQVPTRAEREVSANLQYSNLEKLLENMETAIHAKMDIDEMIHDRLQYMLPRDFQDGVNLERKISHLHEDLFYFLTELGGILKTAENLVISDDVVKVAETFTELALSIRNTFLTKILILISSGASRMGITIFLGILMLGTVLGQVDNPNSFVKMMKQFHSILEHTTESVHILLDLSPAALDPIPIEPIVNVIKSLNKSLYKYFDDLYVFTADSNYGSALYTKTHEDIEVMQMCNHSAALKQSVQNINGTISTRRAGSFGNAIARMPIGPSRILEDIPTSPKTNLEQLLFNMEGALIAKRFIFEFIEVFLLDVPDYYLTHRKIISENIKTIHDTIFSMIELLKYVANNHDSLKVDDFLVAESYNWYQLLASIHRVKPTFDMKLLSVGVFAWSLFFVGASKDQPIHYLFDKISKTLTNMNESFAEFTSLMNVVPMDGLNQSLHLITNIHQNAIQVVNGLCETVRPIIIEYEGEGSKSIGYDSRNIFAVETDKMESYSEGLLKDLKAIKKRVLGLTTESSEETENIVLPIGPPRVYQLYLRSSISTNWEMTDFNQLVNNFMISVDGQVEALRYTGRVLLALPMVYETTWARKEDTVRKLIDSLIDSIKNIIQQEVHSAINDYNFGMNDVSSIYTMSVTPKIHAEALKESLRTLTSKEQKVNRIMDARLVLILFALLAQIVTSSAASTKIEKRNKSTENSYLYSCIVKANSNLREAFSEILASFRTFGEIIFLIPIKGTSLLGVEAWSLMKELMLAFTDITMFFHDIIDGMESLVFHDMLTLGTQNVLMIFKTIRKSLQTIVKHLEKV